MEQDQTIKQKKPVMATVVGVLAFAITYFAVQHFFFKPPTFDKMLMDAASELNKTCPFMVDEETRLDNAVALPGKVFQYNYTLIEYEIDEISVDTAQKYLVPSIINNVKSNPDLQTFRDNQVTLTFNYKDKNGVFIMKFSVTPEMYQRE
jgi:hypothetical protein